MVFRLFTIPAPASKVITLPVEVIMLDPVRGNPFASYFVNTGVVNNIVAAPHVGLPKPSNPVNGNRCIVLVPP